MMRDIPITNYYTVMVEGCSSQKLLYTNVGEAIKEAERLAKDERKKVYLLKAISFFEPVTTVSSTQL